MCVGLWRTNGHKRQFCFLERVLKMSVLAVPIIQTFDVYKNKFNDYDNKSRNKKQWLLDRISKYKKEIKWD